MRNDRTPTADRPSDLGAIVRMHRRRSGMSGTVLAQRAGLNRKTVQRLETSGRASAASISMIERALGLAPATLVIGWDAEWTTSGGSPGSRMRRLRLSKGFGLAEFARMVELHPSTLSRMERGVVADPEDAWLKLVSDHPFQQYLEFRSHDDLEAYLLGRTAFHDEPRKLGAGPVRQG